MQLEYSRIEIEIEDDTRLIVNRNYKKEFKEHTLHTTSMLNLLWAEYFEFKNISEEIANDFNLKRPIL